MFEYRARILRVIDGDTVEAEIDLGFQVSLRATLRLAGIDTSELRGPTRDAGRAASDYLELLLSKLAGPERQVTVRTQKDRAGKYGRYLADLVAGNRNLNEALVLAGHATNGGLTMTIKLGMEAKLYRNTGTYAAPTWVEMLNVKDLTLNLEASEADVTTRGNAGWRATIAALKDGSIEFEMVWDTGDADFTAIKDAFFGNTSIEFAVMDGDVAGSGSQGLRATMSITSFSRSEALEEAIGVSVTAKPTYADNAPEWMTIP